jgi:hypothetical protein
VLLAKSKAAISLNSLLHYIKLKSFIKLEKNTIYENWFHQNSNYGALLNDVELFALVFWYHTWNHVDNQGFYSNRIV